MPAGRLFDSSRWMARLAATLARISPAPTGGEAAKAESALRESEHRHLALIDNLPGAVYRCRNDADYTALYLSPTIERVTGHPAEAFLHGKMTLGGLMHPDDRERVWREIQEGLALNGRYAVEFRIRRADGEERWLADHGSGIHGEDGTLEEMEGLVLDISERKRAAAEGRLRLEAIVRAANVGLWEWDVATNRVHYSPEWKRQLGYDDGEIADDFAEWQSRVHPDDLPLALERIQRYLAEPGLLYRNETRMRHKDGSWRWILVAATLLRDADGKPQRVFGAHVDISERKQAELELRRSAARLRALSHRLVETQEVAWRRLSAELHDRIGQSLTALRINLSIIGSVGPGAPPAALEARLRDSSALLEDTMAAVRDLITELRPAVLDDYGLMAGLRQLVHQFAARTGIEASARGADPMPRLARPLEGALYRIAQEALTNVARHARARHASIELACGPDRVAMTISDDGVGFDPSARKADPSPHWGLALMQERAEFAGGRTRVESAPGRGTQIVVELERAA